MASWEKKVLGFDCRRCAFWLLRAGHVLHDLSDSLELILAYDPEPESGRGGGCSKAAHSFAKYYRDAVSIYDCSRLGPR